MLAQVTHFKGVDWNSWLRVTWRSQMPGLLWKETAHYQGLSYQSAIEKRHTNRHSNTHTHKHALTLLIAFSHWPRSQTFLNGSLSTSIFCFWFQMQKEEQRREKVTARSSPASALTHALGVFLRKWLRPWNRGQFTQPASGICGGLISCAAAG